MNGSGKSPEHYQIEDFVTDESFINYLFHRNTDDEAFWEQWLMADPKNKDEAEAAKEILRSLSITLSEQEYNKELKKLKKSINSRVLHVPGISQAIYRPLQWEKSSPPFTEKRKKNSGFLLVALFILITGLTYFMREYTLKADRLIEKYNGSSNPIVIALSDGSEVSLAPHSRFRYPLKFGSQDRKVYLDGEAKFVVSKDQFHPFEVYTGDLIATVLGTEFIVKKLTADSGMVVELIKGRLKVETTNNEGLSNKEIILNPEERAVYRRQSPALYKEKWSTQNDNPLKNHLLFHQNNFEEIAQQIKNIFGITIFNQSNKKTWRFTGEFKNTSAINIIESICIVEKLNCEVQGDTVFIK